MLEKNKGLARTPTMLVCGPGFCVADYVCLGLFLMLPTDDKTGARGECAQEG